MLQYDGFYYARHEAIDGGEVKKKIPGIRNPDSFTWGDRREKADILRFWKAAHLPLP